MLKWSSLLLGALWIVGSSTSTSAQGHGPEPGYQDDRSTAESVLGSYFDAVNRREYSRAYSYWEPAAAVSQLAPFDQFVAGYADTAEVDLTLGVSADLYGRRVTFVGCYTLHIGRPQIQAVPPFQPLAIQRASIQQIDNDADTAGLMSQSCPAV